MIVSEDGGSALASNQNPVGAVTGPALDTLKMI